MKGKALGVGNNNYRDGHDNIKWGDKMPDITLCTNVKCHLASMCFRAQAEPSGPQQSYAKFAAHENDQGHFACTMFKPICEATHG